MPKNITINARKLAERNYAKRQQREAIAIKSSDTVKKRVSEAEKRLCDARRKAEALRDELRMNREMEL